MKNFLTRLRSIISGTSADKPADGIDPSRTYSATEAAELLGIHERNVQKACKTGRIKASMHKSWRISGHSLLEYSQNK